jgi:hypothetical protein
MISRSIFSHDKYILLALEKNAFLDHSKSVSPSMKLMPHRSELPTASPRWHRQKEEDPHLHTRDTT